MITFFLLGYKGFQVLRHINESMLSMISLVVIGRDKGVDSDFAEELVDWCLRNQISYAERSAFNPAHQTSKYYLFIGWRWMVKTSKETQTIVLHDSLLPKYRGFNPLVTALIEGDTEIGATAIFANSEFDRGDIIIQKSMKIQYPIKIQDAIQMMSHLYKEIVNELLFKLNKNEPLHARPQSEIDVSYSLWRDEDDYRIDWNQNAEKIIRHIHACGNPYRGAFTTYNGEKYRILDAQVIKDVRIANRTSGKVLFKKEGIPVVVCGEGLILLKEIQDQVGKIVEFSNLRIRFI